VVPEIPASTVNIGAGAKGGLTPDFLTLPYREEQEDQLGALGLVVNIIVLWNTLYIDAALEQLQAAGYPVQSEDVARLSPLVFEHINLLGRYAFAVPDSVLRGELRHLRNPADSIEDVA
jgi:hypothetical protein